MPVENIHNDGTMMINKTPDNGVVSDCFHVFPGEILEDEDFSETDLKLIKDKDASMIKYWRYLTDAKANAKKKEKEEKMFYSEYNQFRMKK